MFERPRGISEADVLGEILENGKVIEENLSDVPYPSRLMLGFIEGQPVHVVASDDRSAKAAVVITVYRPDAVRWDKKFRRRKK